MELPEVIEALKKSNILSKEARMEALMGLKALNLFTMRSTAGVFPDNVKNYVNSDENKDLVKLRTAKDLLEEVMRNMRKYSVVVTLLMMACRQINKVCDARKATLSDKGKIALDRQYKHFAIDYRTIDTNRFNPDTEDEERVNVNTVDLYDLAAGAIEAWCVGCDGKRKECRYRGMMEILRIPDNKNGGVCPYGPGEELVLIKDFAERKAG